MSSEEPFASRKIKIHRNYRKTSDCDDGITVTLKSSDVKSSCDVDIESKENGKKDLAKVKDKSGKDKSDAEDSEGESKKSHKKHKKHKKKEHKHKNKDRDKDESDKDSTKHKHKKKSKKKDKDKDKDPDEKKSKVTMDYDSDPWDSDREEKEKIKKFEKALKKKEGQLKKKDSGFSWYQVDEEELSRIEQGAHLLEKRKAGDIEDPTPEKRSKLENVASCNDNEVDDITKNPPEESTNVGIPLPPVIEIKPSDDAVPDHLVPLAIPQMVLPPVCLNQTSNTTTVPQMVPPPSQTSVHVASNGNSDNVGCIALPPDKGSQSVSQKDMFDKPSETVQNTTAKKTMGLKFGLKLSDSSRALISSGVRVEDEKKKNLEEGELSESEDSKSQAPSNADISTDDEKLPESDGEIDKVTEGTTSSGKKKKKKSKDDKKKKKKHRSSKDRDDRDRSKDRDKSKDRKRSRDKDRKRSRTPKKHRSKSRSRSPRSRSKAVDFDKRTGVWRSRSRSRSRDRKRRSRSRSRDRSRAGRDFYASFYRGRSRERDRKRHSRSRSKSPRMLRAARARTPDDLRIKIDKAKLREIALRNAVENMKAGRGPTVNLKPDEVAILRAGGKSINELTEFCKKIAKKDGSFSSDESGDDMSHLYPNSDEEDAAGKPFHHPFKINDQANIAINIRNMRQLPTSTPVERTIQNAELRLQFPVSSGSQHRTKESEWVPVEKDKASTSSAAVTTPAPPAPSPSSSASDSGGLKAIMPPPPVPPAPVPAADKPKEEDKVFPDPPSEDLNIGDIVSSRLSAIRKLQNNPNDVQAISNMYKINKQMTQWAASKQLPGQFTGSTGVQTLTPSELQGGHQAWVRKDTFKAAAPVTGGIGKLLLERMGWKYGEGLGRNKEGTLEPLALDVKNDRKGLSSDGELHVKGHGRGGGGGGGGGPMHMKPQQAMAKDFSGKHPVSALVEICNKRRWGSPEFIVVTETGPDHKKNFLFKVIVNRVEYQPTIGSNTKKNAKAQAATVALQELGMIPRDT